MAERDRGVSLLAGEKNGDGLADDVGPSDNDGVLTLYVHAGKFDKFNYAVRSAGQKALFADKHLTDVDRRKTVDVLFGRDRVDYGLVADVLRNGKLNENTVYRGIGVELLNEFHELILGRRFGKTDLARIHTRFDARLFLSGHVTDARGIVADENDRKTGNNAFFLFKFRGGINTYDSCITPYGNNYVSFIAGDNPYTVINVPENPQDKNILVLKDSFGNAFVPYLCEHYGNIIVVDVRYTDMNVYEHLKDYGLTDIVFVNNVQAALSTTWSKMYLKAVGVE